MMYLIISNGMVFKDLQGFLSLDNGITKWYEFEKATLRITR